MRGMTPAAAVFCSVIGLAGAIPADEVWGKGEDLVVGIRCETGLPAKNLLPDDFDLRKGLRGWRCRDANGASVVAGAGPHGEAVLGIPNRDCDVWRTIPCDIIRNDREYVLACWIKTDADVSMVGAVSAGLGCELTTWEPGWTNGLGISCYGAGSGTWQRIVGKPGRLVGGRGPNEFHVKLRCSKGSGQVCGLALFEASVKLELSARAPSYIRQVKVVDETGAVAYDSGVIVEPTTHWRKAVDVRPGHVYSMLAVSVDGDVATVDYPNDAVGSGGKVVSRDIVIYGATPAGLSAAVQAGRMGLSCVLVSADGRIGGMTTGGLGSTDIGNKAAFGGIALEFYRAVADYYRDGRKWKWQSRDDYLSDAQCADASGDGSMWRFEPSVALRILEGWERRDGLEIVRGKRLDRSVGKVKMEGGRKRIVSFLTEDGTEYRGKVFIDATYEGDLMAASGVSYCVGREANAAYGETLGGNAPCAKGAWNHNFNDGVSPYVKANDRRSGLLPGIEPYDQDERTGDGDRRIQAYCFRMCLTDVPENRIPFVKPEGYDERDYELLFRDYEKAWSGSGEKPVGARVWMQEPLPINTGLLPNRKTDSNNRGGFSTDCIGRNWDWPEASYAEREKMLAEHLAYQMGLMWTLANHPRIPEEVRAHFSRYGTCKDEFWDGLGNGWPRQLYVREARRMVGEYVMTEQNCRGLRKAQQPVAMGAYGMDSHHVRRMETKEGFVRNEGNVEEYNDFAGRRFPPYGIDYGAIVPKRGECVNLLVPVCLSASHIAFGSIRMEPVFFALGQDAGTAAAQAISAGCAVQDLPYAPLRTKLLADGQVVE